MASSHRKCAISDIAITSARNNIFWQDKKQLIGHRKGFIYFRSRVGQGACQHPNTLSLWMVIYTVLAKKSKKWKKYRKKKNEKKKNARNNFWGPCQVLNMYIPYHIEWLYIQSWQKNRKNQKKSKKLKKIKNHRNNFWGPCQVLNMSLYMYIVAYIAARIYRGWHESQECAIFKLR